MAKGTRVYQESPYRLVYVIGIPGCPMVKIGIADCPGGRLRSLQQGSDTTLLPAGLDRSQLQLLHKEPGGRRSELALHRYFASRRVVGEWFDLGPVAVPLIKSVLRDLRAKLTS